MKEAILNSKGFRKMDLTVRKGVYPPSEDTFLLIDAIRSEDVSGRALELCAGSGAVGLSIAEKLDSIIAVDINPAAAENTVENYRINGLAEKVDAVAGDLFSPLWGRRFDLIIMNPPYLADEGGPTDLSWSGGEDGRRVIDRFLKEVPEYLSGGGRAFFLQTDANGIDRSLGIAGSCGMDGRVVRSAEFMFEQLVVIRLALKNQVKEE